MTVEGTPFATWEKAGFDGNNFPYSELTIKGATRYTVHEFPHAPGGEVEKMGRRPYVFSFRAFFHDVPGSPLNREYPLLLVTTLPKLRGLFDAETTGDLLVPNIGKIKATCTSWTERIDTKTTSGVTVEMEFLEDTDRATLVDAVTELGTYPAFEEKSDEVFRRAALADFNSTASIGFMQRLSNAITMVQGVFGTADAYTRVAEAKVRAVENLVIWADDQLADLQKPENHLVAAAFRDLGISARALADNVSESRMELLIFRVPSKMSVMQISTTLYGTSEKSYDLMQLNDFDDALAIRAGTQVKYLSVAA